MDYNDYVFWARNRGNILAIESLPANLAEGHARRLARKHRTTVSYGIVSEYFVEPEKCPNCQEVLPEVGPCWCNFFEEEAPDSIPFRGEAFPARIITEQDEYF